MPQLIPPYLMRPVRVAYVQVIGTIWMPAITCAQELKLSDYDLENIGEFSRENVEQWLCTHTGDFQGIKDFHAQAGDVIIPWEKEESEFTYSDCMYSSEE